MLPGHTCPRGHARPLPCMSLSDACPRSHAHPQPRMPPTMHAPQSCTPPVTHASWLHMAPCHTHTPGHACPLPCTPPKAMHAPLPCTPPVMHAPPATHAPPPAMHALLPRTSPSVDRILDTCFWKYYLAPASLRTVIRIVINCILQKQIYWSFALRSKVWCLECEHFARFGRKTDGNLSSMNLSTATNLSRLTIVFFLFCIRLVELLELGDFNQNQSSMTEGY